MKKLVILFVMGILFSSLVFASISPDLNTDDEELSVIISLREKVLPSHVQELVNEKAKMGHQFKLINAVSAKIPRNALDKISKFSFVESIEPDYQIYLVLDKGAYEIQSNYVWENNLSGKNIDVAIIDTGIFSHNSLNIVKEIDFTGEGTTDLNGHGTHVAGIVSSKDTNYKGIAFDSNLFNVKVLNKYGQGYASNLIKGIEWAVENGAEIISLSLGAQLTNCDGTDAISKAVDKASQTSIVVVAAGNSGPGEKTITSPGCAKQAITVGATDGDTIASFSSRGPTTDGRIKPDVVAPGVKITSTWLNNEFKAISGTSMSTPFVSGAVALLLEQNSSVKTSDVKDILSSSSKDLGLNENSQGYGKLDAYEAYKISYNEEISEPENETIIDEPKKVIEKPSNRGLGRAWERIQLALTFNPLKKAELHMAFAEKRLQEAVEFENLASLTEYEENLNKANSLIESAKAKGKDVSDASLNVLEKTMTYEELLNDVLNLVSEEDKLGIQNKINLSKLQIEENLFFLENSTSQKAVEVNLKLAEKALETEVINVDAGENLSLDNYTENIERVDKLVVEAKKEIQEIVIDSSVKQKEILKTLDEKVEEKVKPVVRETIQKVEARQERATKIVEQAKGQSGITGRVIAWFFG